MFGVGLNSIYDGEDGTLCDDGFEHEFSVDVSDAVESCVYGECGSGLDVSFCDIGDVEFISEFF